MYHELMVAHIAFIFLCVVILGIMPLAASDKVLKKKSEHLGFYTAFIIITFLYFTLHIGVDKKITPDSIQESKYGVFVEYNGTPGYFTDSYVKKFHSDSSKVQYYYNEDWYPFFNEEQYITFEKK